MHTGKWDSQLSQGTGSSSIHVSESSWKAGHVLVNMRSEHPHLVAATGVKAWPAPAQCGWQQVTAWGTYRVLVRESTFSESTVEAPQPTSTESDPE